MKFARIVRSISKYYSLRQGHTDFILLDWDLQFVQTRTEAMKCENQLEMVNRKHGPKRVSKVGQLSWTPLSQESKSASLWPSPRYLHSAQTASGKLYVLGGANSLGPLKESKLHVLDLSTLKWTTIDAKNYCEGRSGHSCTVLRHQLYFFGGTQGGSPTSTFIKFSPGQNTWTLLQALENVPSPRELALLATIRQSFIFLFGGINIHQDKIYEDAFAFVDNQWRCLNITGNLSPRIKIRHAICGNRLFLFGGEGPSENNSLLFNDLHEAVIDELTLELAFQEVTTTGPKPQQRTAHGMVTITEYFFLIYGGQTCDKGGKTIALHDIWVFDVQELRWNQIQCCEGRMSPRYDFSMCGRGNELFIFGGFDQDNNIIDGIAKIDYIPLQKKQLDLCLDCIQSTGQSLFNEISIKFSGGFLHSLAQEVSFPFRAIELITDSAAILGSKHIDISFLKNKEEFDLLVFEFHSQKHLSDNTFLDFTESDQNENESRAVHLMKIGALRLGKTMLYIRADRHTRKVFLTSVDNKYGPNFQQGFTHYSYIEEIDSGEIYPTFAQPNKKAIYNILKGHFDDPFVLLSRKQGDLLLILQVNILPTVEKAYYYELINYGYPENDIKIYFNEKKLQFLEQLGLKMSHNPEFSLKHYLAISKLQRDIRISINHCPETIDCHNYLSLLNTYHSLALVQRINIPLKNLYVQQCHIFKSNQSQYLEYNQGILIYCSNQLIERYKCPFGQLIPNKFYRKKNKRSMARRNLFQFLGVIELSPALGLNLLQTKVKKKIKYMEFVEELTEFLKGERGGDQNQGERMSHLYDWRFSWSKQGGKRQKKDGQ